VEKSRCPVCGYDKDKKYNPSKNIMKLKRERTRYLKKLLTQTSNNIMANIPSENDITREYMFYQSISKIEDGVVEYIVKRYLSDKPYLKGKGFKYLTAMILNYNTNKEVVSKNELLMRGKPPSVVTIKED
tara:strand:- start:20804 stop:21193 length:390 start_codon:yes stop_codon:yes gene_type:complete